ncbi:hypothetical protein QTO02_18025, partial [Vibrio fortis]
MEQFLNVFSPMQLMNYEANVCDYARRISGASGMGSFEWRDADGFPFLFSDNVVDTYKTSELHNFYTEVELSVKVYMAIANLVVSNAYAWRYHEQTNKNQDLS